MQNEYRTNTERMQNESKSIVNRMQSEFKSNVNHCKIILPNLTGIIKRIHGILT